MSHNLHRPIASDTMHSSRRPGGDKPLSYTKLPPLVLPPSGAIHTQNQSFLTQRPYHLQSQSNGHQYVENYHAPSLPAVSKAWDAPSTSSHDFARKSSHIAAPLSQNKFQRDHLRYSLKFYQQPMHARMVGNGQKADRRPVDPPPILKLEMVDSSQPNQSMDLTLLRSPYFICYSTLCKPNAPYEELLSNPDSGKAYMTGGIVSSSFHLREDQPLPQTSSSLHLQQGIDRLPAGHYFRFCDLGVRVEGCYRLKFSVFEMVDDIVIPCATALSNEFQVFSAKNFPGMTVVTPISEVFSFLGLRMRSRKKIKAESPPPEISKNQRVQVENKKMRKKRKVSYNKEEKNITSNIRNDGIGKNVASTSAKIPPQPLSHTSKSSKLAEIKLAPQPNSKCILPPIACLLNFTPAGEERRSSN